MKLKVQHVFDALPVITAIVNENRPMPQKGKYRLARLYSKLLPEFEVITKQRDAMIKAYEFPLMVVPTSGGEPVPSGGFAVPPSKVEEFSASWAKIAEEEIEVDVQPIPFAQLDLGDETNGSLTAAELITLGALVSE